MRSLRSRLFLLFILVVFFNAVIISGAAFWGSLSLRREWRVIAGDESVRRLAAVVQSLWSEHGELTADNSREPMNQITHFAEELASFAVYDADQKPVYYWQNRGYPGLAPDFRLEPQYAVLYEGQTIGWVACEPSDFYFIDTNQGIVMLMTQTLIAGLLISLSAAVASSRRMSSRVAAEAGELASKLDQLSRGDRQIPFPDQNISEFQTIARASHRLQNTLSGQEVHRRQWTQDIAHDLKTPVTALRSQLEAVKDGVFELTEERYQALEQEFFQIDKLVQDLAVLSRVESPEMLPQLRELSVSSFTEQIESRFTAVATAAGLELQCTHTGDEFVLTDPDLLSRAVNNLVQNAIQHTAESGSVLFIFTAEQGGAAITVENPGRIAEEDLPRLFERLYRGDSGRSTPGTGLGLTIARAIAEKFSGSLTVRNTSRHTVRMRLVMPSAGH